LNEYLSIPAATPEWRTLNKILSEYNFTSSKKLVEGWIAKLKEQIKDPKEHFQAKKIKNGVYEHVSPEVRLFIQECIKTYQGTPLPAEDERSLNQLSQDLGISYPILERYDQELRNTKNYEEKDITVITNLLESRLLIGEHRLFDDLHCRRCSRADKSDK
jgi:hypothetical protein